MCPQQASSSFGRSTRKRGYMARKQGSGQMSKLMNKIKIPIEENMKNDNETSLQQLNFS